MSNLVFLLCVYEEIYLRECDYMEFSERLSTFRRNILPVFSEQERNLRTKVSTATSCLFA
jgi:hypothetical protein